MTDITNLNEQRAIKEKDCTKWTPRDLLQAMIRDIDSGKIAPSQMAVHFLNGTPEAGQTHGVYVANLSRTEHIALLALASGLALEDWIR